jgi:hypothetical protein
MDNRCFLVALCFAGLAGSGVAQDRAGSATVHLALAGGSFPNVAVEQRSDRASIRLPALPDLARTVPVPAPLTRPAAHKRPVIAPHRGAAPLNTEGVEAGYEQLFPAPPARSRPQTPAEFRSTATARGAAILTVLSGAAGAKLDAEHSRASEAERVPELLFAVRAGF